MVYYRYHSSLLSNNFEMLHLSIRLNDIIFPCSYPYLTLLSSLVSCAAHFAFKLDQSFRSLFLSSITDSRNLTILLGRLELNCAWILVIVSRTERFFLAIYCESNILHPLETSENIAIPKDITIFLRYFFVHDICHFWPFMDQLTIAIH